MNSVNVELQSDVGIRTTRRTLVRRTCELNKLLCLKAKLMPNDTF